MAENNEQVSKREQTLKNSLIDEEYITGLIRSTYDASKLEREEMLARKAQFEESWRNLLRDEVPGPWENSANYHVPITLTYIKAAHARLWQLFSNPSGFFDCQSRSEAFKDKEVTVKNFMNWVLESKANCGHGCRREIDQFLWDVVGSGSGYLKVYWKKEVRQYLDVVASVEQSKELIFDQNNLTGRKELKATVVEKDVMREEIIESPQIKRIHYEDVIMPLGENDPQTSTYVMMPVYFSDDDLKEKASQGIFYSDIVQEALGMKEDIFAQGETASELKHQRNTIDGYGSDAFSNNKHVVFEWYGKAYVEREVHPNDFDRDIKKQKVEIVAWVHKGLNRVIGWTYLYRISPSGLRPIFKADYMTFPDRTDGVGIGEMMYDISRHIDAVYNMRMDNGTLASVPMFKFRASSQLKPSNYRIRPGQGIPVDDINDLQVFQFPFLQGFGYQEENQLTTYGERLVAMSDLQLGRAPAKVGALRNATGANLLASESGIQLEIHFDRIAHCMGQMLKCAFALCRERIPEGEYFRVTGERGEPIFGKVEKSALRGDFQFGIQVDILGQSQLERQQQSVLVMQTLLNPAYMNTGVVGPKNLYALAKNFLKAHKFTRIDDFLTPPQDYEGDYISPHERISRIVLGALQDPPIEDTVRLMENHEKALKTYEAFEASDLMGLLTNPVQLAALQRLKQRHQELMMAQQSGGNPNLSGMQIPREGFAGISPEMGGGGEALQSPVGEPNGPVI